MIIQKPCEWGEYFKIIIQRPDYQNPITNKRPRMEASLKTCYSISPR